MSFSGLKSRLGTNVVLDGELIPSQSFNDRPLPPLPPRFMCFDAYYVDGKDIRDFPLMSKERAQHDAASINLSAGEGERNEKDKKGRGKEGENDVDDAEEKEEQEEKEGERTSRNGGGERSWGTKGVGEGIRTLTRNLITNSTRKGGAKDATYTGFLNRVHKQKDRIGVARMVLEESGFEKARESDVECGMKEFLYVSGPYTLSRGVATILRKKEARLYPYDIDGIIFTPAFLPVGARVPQQKHSKKTGGTWDMVVKWKPPHMNTIDFLVRFDSGEIVKKKDGSLCKVANLYVAKEEEESISALAFMLGKLPMESNNRRDGKLPIVPALFQPANERRIVHKALLRMDEEGRVLLSDGMEISSNIIVEFALDGPLDDTREVKERWMPVRVRHDKTERFLETGKIKGTANAMKIAEDTWESIHEPVTEKHLLHVGSVDPRKNPCSKHAKDDDGRESSPYQEGKYYVQKGRRDVRASLPMDDFHNAWIKERVLLKTFSGHQVRSLFDVGTGKGGDVGKWFSMGSLNKVFGIDLVRDNIENPCDGAYRRLMNKVDQAVFKQRVPRDRLPTVVFLPFDARIPLTEEYIETIVDPEDRFAAKVLWAVVEEGKLPTPLRRYHGFCREPFDLVSCQFSIHYFFGNQTDLRTFAENVSSMLRPGGYFVGATLDGARVNEILANKKVGEFIEGVAPDGRVMWHIRKLYEGNMMDAPLVGRLGYKIAAYMESIGATFEEFLVDPLLLQKTMDDAGLQLLPNDEVDKLNLPGTKGNFEELFHMMIQSVKKAQEGMSQGRKPTEGNASAMHLLTDKRIHSATNMTDEHKKYSFLNHWFVYQKKPTL